MYNKDQQDLLQNTEIPLQILGDAAEVFYEMALDMIEEIVKNNDKGEKTVFICPVGPVGQYPIFVRLVNRDRISLKNVYFITMDEYLDENEQSLGKDNPLSFGGIMQREVYDKIDQDLIMPEENRINPAPGNEAYIMETIERLGGVDICFGGVGINGHVAFNEPPEPGVEISNEEFKELATRIVDISRETIVTNSMGALGGAIKAMPTKAVTIGFKEILSARKIKLYCFRDWHGAIVREALFGDITASCPVSLLREHPGVTLTLTNNSAVKPY